MQRKRAGALFVLQAVNRRISHALLAAAAAMAIAATPASGAGMTTHAFMAEKASTYVETPELRRLLVLNRQQLLAGAQFPDSGYAPGTGFGETSHWERFVNVYADHIRAVAPQRGCDLEAAISVCAGLVAHLMGTAAHGMGDETWDWLFEPRTVDHGEYPANKCFNDPHHTDVEHFCPVNLALLDGTPPDDLSSTIEYAMDIAVISAYGRALGYSPLLPPVNDLLPVYARLGEANGTADKMLLGHGLITAALTAERAVSPPEAQRLRRQMPWTFANVTKAPGGVEWSARAIARYYESLWKKLQQGSSLPDVAAVYPARNARDVPYVWPAGKTSPGPHTGGGENRIIAVMTNAVFPASVSPETFYVLDADGNRVAPASGFPKPGPYHATEGTHSLMFYPAADLEPCTKYTAVLTTGLRDWRGEGGALNPLPREHRWKFTTRPPAGAKSCPRRRVS